jgi:integrase
LSTIKITEAVRTDRVRRPLVPSVTKDAEIKGLALHVTRTRSFWAQVYQPHGVNPRTGRRYGGGTRFELGDAQLIGVAEARGLALAAKARVRMGEDPHRERMAARATTVARRAILPTTAGSALDLYAQAVSSRAHLSESTKRAINHYTRKAVRILGGENIALSSIDTRSVLLLIGAVDSSAFERRQVFSALNRFLTWCKTRGFVDANSCDAIDADDRPKPGLSRDHTPSLETLRLVWAAAEHEPEHVRSLIRFLLLVPLRREEAQGLRWTEVDGKRIRIAAERTKTRAAHELPLSKPVLVLLAERETCRAGDRVFASRSGAETINWNQCVTRIRAAIGESGRERRQRFNLHDIRRAFVSHLAEHGFDVDLLDQCLGHGRKGVLGIYQRSARMHDRAVALNAWADLITDDAHDNVVRLRA